MSGHHSTPRTHRNSFGAASAAPLYETLGHKKRTNSTFVNFGKTKGRDNAMYYLSDGYNLADKDGEFSEPVSEFDFFLQTKMLQTQLNYSQRPPQMDAKSGDDGDDFKNDQSTAAYDYSRLKEHNDKEPHVMRTSRDFITKTGKNSSMVSTARGKQPQNHFASFDGGIGNQLLMTASASGYDRSSLMGKYSKVVDRIAKMTRRTARKRIEETDKLLSLTLEDKILLG